MSDSLTERWRRLFKKNCSHWSDEQKRRYINVVNDPDEVDEVELQSAIELIEEVNKKPPVE